MISRVRRRFTQSFKVAPVTKQQYALVGEDIAGEKSPTEPHGPKWYTPQAPATQDLDTLCVVGSGLNVCPLSLSDGSVTGWTGSGVLRSDAPADSQQSARSRMSASTKSKRGSNRGLGGDRLQRRQNSLTEEVTAS